MAWRALIRRQADQELLQRVDRTGAEIVHLFAPLAAVAPATLEAIRRRGAAVVQTLLDYDPLCMKGTLYRNGSLCESCVGSTLGGAGVWHACFGNSRLASAAMAILRRLRWPPGASHGVANRYVVSSEFTRQKYILSGLPADQVRVVFDGCAPDPEMGDGAAGFALVAGPMTPESGVPCLLEAWQRLGEPIELRLVGDGPCVESIRRAADANGRIRWLGARTEDEVLQMLGDAAMFLVPATWHSVPVRSVIASLARGTPVIASRRGPLAELIDHHGTGLLFAAGSSADLAEKVEWLVDHPDEWDRMRQAARLRYESAYSTQVSYRRLMSVYEEALGRVAPPVAAAWSR